ncbi:MAG: hypothetical protein COV47_01280 [Candidatus Diapherotrites archaeon CG11_big_fil_rev_8_21_14_0_20_37_9]|nr:MAG: hypothetical protein COV47_01280 [Candidatus Diapherotrites archaeon CG11_big_fil_rev_8_21_14_0_20_37_9]
MKKILSIKAIQMNFGNEINNLQKAAKLVYSKKKYYAITIAIAIGIIFSINLAINSSLIFSIISGNYLVIEKITILFSLLSGTFSNNTELTIITLTIVGILTGINASFIMYKFSIDRKLSKRNSIAGAVGTVIGLFAGGCASCAFTIAALFGVVGALSFLPFKGVELTIIGIGILIFALFNSAKSVLGVCELPKK